jgi:hypothetical protein
MKSESFQETKRRNSEVAEKVKLRKCVKHEVVRFCDTVT